MPIPENAETGWEVFRDNDYELTLGEINDELVRRDLSPVSERMFRHYRKLHRHGFEQYIPINQLDVKTMEDPIWDRAIRGRFVMQPVEEAVRVVLLRNDAPIALDGLAEEVSDGEVVLRLPGSSALAAFSDGAPVWTLDVVFTSTGEIRLCEVLKVTLDRKRDRVTVRATFSRVAATDELVSLEPLASRTLTITVGSDPRSHCWLRPLSNSSGSSLRARACASLRARRYAKEADLTLVARSQRTASSTFEFRVHWRSPSSRRVPVRLLSGLSQLIQRVVDTRKSWWEGSKARVDVAISNEELLRLRWDRQRRETIGSIDVTDIAREIASAVRQELGSGEPEEEHVQSVAGTLASHVLPALAELAELAEGTIETSSDQDAEE